MTGPSSTGLMQLAWDSGRTRYPDFDVRAEDYFTHLRGICAKYCPHGCSDEAVCRFVGTLHAVDLYLSIGCACRAAGAWTRFAADFQDYISRLASAIIPVDEAAELTDCVIVDLFLPDKSGRSRIASYDGRSSLATWLRVLVAHRATNERKRKWSRHATLDTVVDVADELALPKLDAEVRARRYSVAVEDALRHACAQLTDRERLVLRLRYETTMQVQQIATCLHVHPSNVTRQIERVCDRLRTAVIRTLDQKYGLSDGAIEECLVDLRENPSYSILALLGDGGDLRYASA